MLQRAEPNGRRFHHDLSAYGLDARVMLTHRAQQASQARLFLVGLNSLRDSIHARRFPSAAMDAEDSSAAAQDEPPAPAPAPAAAAELEPAPATAAPTAGRRFT
eukprot:5090105-Pleurochrysis_carterae.AAC.1